MITKLKLDRLSELQAELDILNIKKREMLEDVLSEEVRQRIANIESSFKDKAETINNSIKELSEAIKDEVIGVGTTVKGTNLQAVYSKGRTSWDTKGLGGYAVANPEINRFKKVGEPSVSIRKVA